MCQRLSDVVGFYRILFVLGVAFHRELCCFQTLQTCGEPRSNCTDLRKGRSTRHWWTALRPTTSRVAPTRPDPPWARRAPFGPWAAEVLKRRHAAMAMSQGVVFCACCFGTRHGHGMSSKKKTRLKGSNQKQLSTVSQNRQQHLKHNHHQGKSYEPNFIP